MNQLNTLLTAMSKDLVKVHRGNRTAAQRIRVNSIKFEKVARHFRKESVTLEKTGKFKRKSARKKRRKKR